MPAIEQGCLHLRGALDTRRVPALARALRRSPPLDAIDLSGVESVDSAGVAFVRWLQRRERLRRQATPALRGVPDHYTQLCRAHRVNGQEV